MSEHNWRIHVNATNVIKFFVRKLLLKAIRGHTLERDLLHVGTVTRFSHIIIIFLKQWTKCTGEKPYQSIHRSKAFSQNRNYVGHITTHCGGRPHKWSYCDKNFTLDSESKWHVNIHTGDREYHWSYCDKSSHKCSGLAYSWLNY